MKTVQIMVEDNRLETLLTIVKNLKKDIIKGISVSDVNSFSIPTVSDTENRYYQNILKNMTDDDRTIASEKSFTI